jgi:hypothetical protein
VVARGSRAGVAGLAGSEHGQRILCGHFSAVDSDSSRLADSFENYCRIRLDGFLGHYAHLIPPDAGERVRQQPTVAACLSRLQEELELLGDHRLYLFIDEYDNFANNLLVREGRGK